MKSKLYYWLKSNLFLKVIEWGFSVIGLKDNRKGEWLLFSQIILIISHLLPSWPEANIFLANKVISSLIIVIGLYKCINALVSLGSSLSPLPDPKENNKLVTKLSYSKCRHPLYNSLIIISFGFLILKASLIHLLLFISLCITLRRKARREEEKLIVIHSQYKDYMLDTPAIFKHLKFFDWRD